MNIKNFSLINALVFFTAAATIPVPVVAADLSLATKPLFLTSVKPNVMVMLDNSGSMKDKMYKPGFDPTISYYGLFEATKNYVYDATIPVNAAGYAPMTASTIDTTKTGAFKESNCTPAAANTTCWSGNFLNWITTRRIDASRKVLMGGKLENSSGAFNYGANLNYKIVGNNEHMDGNVDNRFNNLTYSLSSNYSPVPNGSRIAVYSPSEGGTVKAKYDPYAKINVSAGGAGFIYNATGNIIGEFGTTSATTNVNPDKTLKDSSWVSVTLQGVYTNAPVVIAGAPTHNGGQPGVARIKDVTNTGFKIAFQEWSNLDGDHATETFNYVVMKKGAHVLPGGQIIDADTVSTGTEWVEGNCGTVRNTFVEVPFNTTFSNSPEIVSSVMSFNDPTPVTSRIGFRTTTKVRLALQEEEKKGGHLAETVGYIAMETGAVTDNVNTPNWLLEVNSTSSVTKATKQLDFTSSFDSAPVFISGLRTGIGDDTAALRLNSLNKTSAKFHVEEETTCDNEVDADSSSVSSFAFEAKVDLPELNIALVVENEPTGLLHDIDDKVRLGVSFYRYNPDANNIYQQNIDGGTLNFKIPKNPFVKKPSDGTIPAAERGYRDVSGYIGMSVDNAADVLENYPLVWGTTPLAENLWEVVRYFEQETPRYANVGGVADFVPNKGTVNDPYYYASYNKKLECAKSSVIIFTDGEPYQDQVVPGFTIDFDGDNKASDDNANVANGRTDLLDDVAYYAFCASQGVNAASCADAITGNGDRDLRADIPGDQFLKVHTVAFGASSIPPVLQDTADNAGGKAYLAEDGAKLRASLEEAFTAAIDESSAAAVSVNTGSLTSDTVVFQAQFNSSNWTGTLLAYPVDTSDGSLEAAVTASIIPAHGSRKIATFNGTKGVPFQWPADPANPTADEITVAQQALLDDSASLLVYLRGDQSNEEGSGTGEFRARSSLLGDLINSSPAYVGDESAHVYSDALESAAHSAFRSAVSGRKPVVYVGANDGMLHAFNADATDANDDGTIDDANFGKEVFAFVPNQVLSRLPALGAKDYAHQYTVDGSPTVGDAYFDPAGGNNESWHTVLVAGLNGGGQGIYALDITDPVTDVTTEAQLAAKVLWEFTDTDDDNDDADGNVGESGDQELGFTYSQPNIVRLANGDWAAVFGNGYNNTANDASKSTTGRAVLYLVSIETGKLIKKFDTGVGTNYDDGVHSVPTTPNGMSTVAPVDFNGDSIVDFIYGGDLYGNLWRFDVSGNNTNQWGIANNAPVFTASYPVTTCVDPDDDATCTTAKVRQPITTRPQVGLHPQKSGYMVYFGTGKYLESGDNSTQDQLTQSFYGIWDKDENWASFNTFHLLQQSILEENCYNVVDVGGTDVLQQIACVDGNGDDNDRDFDLRISSDNSIIWHTDEDASVPSDGGDDGDLADTHLGWYMHLYNTDTTANANGDNYGERQVSNSILRNGRIIFTTLLPSEDPCSGGGSGWLMELDADTGSRLEFTPFDLNGDDAFNALDFVEVVIGTDDQGEDIVIQVPVSGKKSKEGIIASPAIVDDGGREFKYNSGSKGGVEVTKENPGPQYIGRQSWKQLGF